MGHSNSSARAAPQSRGVFGLLIETLPLRRLGAPAAGALWVWVPRGRNNSNTSMQCPGPAPRGRTAGAGPRPTGLRGPGSTLVLQALEASFQTAGARGSEAQRISGTTAQHHAAASRAARRSRGAPVRAIRGIVT